MEEQGFKNEFDEYDEMVPHAVLFMEGCAVATGRLLPGDELPQNIRTAQKRTLVGNIKI